MIRQPAAAAAGMSSKEARARMGPLRKLLLAATAVLIVASPAGASPYDITIEKNAAPAESAADGSGSLGRNSQTPASMRTKDASGAGDIAPPHPQARRRKRHMYGGWHRARLRRFPGERH
jgi:hypothetical protein